MRTRKLIAGLLVLGLAVSVLGMIGFAKPGHGNGVQNPTDTVADKVSWTVKGFIELTIDNSAYDFGAIDAGEDTATDEKANTLYIVSNTEWVLDYSVEGTGSEHLAVKLGADGGTGDATINVGYSLFDLRSMNPGTYTVTVTYTVTAN